jgi:glucose/arabinose dehydrogenase
MLLRKVEFYTTLKRLKTEVKNVPEVYIRGQGGLLDIVLHPDYAKMVGFTSLCFHGRRRRRWKY